MTHGLFPSRKVAVQYAIISGALVAFFIGLFTALQTTTSLNTSVIYTLVPLIGAVLALIAGVKTRKRQWLGYLLGSGGAITVLLFTRSGTLTWHTGDVIYLGACVLLAFHVVAIQLWAAKVPAFIGAYRILFFGTLWLIPATALWGELSLVQWHAPAFWGLLGYLSLFTTLLSFVIQQRIVSESGASRLLAFSYTIPIWVAGYVAIEHMAWQVLSVGFVVGTLLVLTALVMIDASATPKRVSQHGTATA